VSVLFPQARRARESPIEPTGFPSARTSPSVEQRLFLGRGTAFPQWWPQRQQEFLTSPWLPQAFALFPQAQQARVRLWPTAHWFQLQRRLPELQSVRAASVAFCWRVDW
jgi:hypothetical protein